MSSQAIKEYLKALNTHVQAGNATEHTHRPAMQTLLEEILPDLLITNEPQRIKCGAPDFILTHGKIPVGYIEAKDIGVNLDDKKHGEQFARYRASLTNLIITDYLEFRFFRSGERVATVRIGRLEEGKIVTASQTELTEWFDHLLSFAAFVGEPLSDPKKLAEEMACRARLLARAIETALNADGGSEEVAEMSLSLTEQLAAFREALIHEITSKEFSDIYAQTIAYGMFAARLQQQTGGEFDRHAAARLVPATNPFLRKFFQYVAGYDLDRRIVWIVDELASLFRSVDMTALLEIFARRTQGREDAFLHFYETFLCEYDPKLRKSRGVWYTPEAVVRFIVRGVDEVLKSEFGLAAGLADGSKVALPPEKKNISHGDTEEENAREVHRVQILDPATGTGTFLAEVIRFIREGFVNREGLWSGYVEHDLLPRLNGFELLMASYAMAHLKLDMALRESGYRSVSEKPQRFQVYLTNTLEEDTDKTPHLPFAKWLSAEANAANRVKRTVPVMCVLGNPPYSVSSLNNGDWIRNLTQVYKEGLNERNINPLSDDYIKFIRYAQHLVSKTGEGVVALITNNSFLDGLIHRQMRGSLLEEFDKIFIVNLHGNAKKKETTPEGGKDENVFDIMQGVSINVFVKTSSSTNCADVFYHDLYGRREDKYQFLYENNLETAPWQKLKPREPHFFFVPKDFSGEKEYKRGFGVQELFITHTPGIKTHRDGLVVDQNRQALKKRMLDFFNKDIPVDKIKTQYCVKEIGSWSVGAARDKGFFDEKKIYPFAYRIFDDRYLYYDSVVVDRDRRGVMKNFLDRKNIALLISRQQSTFSFQHSFITYLIADCNSLSLQTKEAPSIFPLYLYPDEDDLLEEEKRRPNLNPQIVERIANGIGLRFAPEEGLAAEDAEERGGEENEKLKMKNEEWLSTDYGHDLGKEDQAWKTADMIDDLSVSIKRPQGAGVHQVSASERVDDFPDFFTPLNLLDYIYAVLHSPGYRKRFAEFLKIDFPRVPYPTDAAEFWRLVGFGGELRRLHLLEGERLEAAAARVGFPAAGNNEVTKILFDPFHEEMSEIHTPHPKLGRVWINKTQYFSGVSAAAWEFFIGGYQPAQKWLKDRKGRALTYEELNHYPKIVAALTETGRIMGECEVQSFYRMGI